MLRIAMMTLILVTASLIPAVAGAPIAGATVCGFNQQLETVPGSGTTISFWGLSFTVGSGQQQIAHYGNCTNSKDKISITQAGGRSRTGCAPPGDVRLGPAVGSDAIIGASKVGPC